MIPTDDFTPYGYLDNPYHSWKLNPSGVLRSMAPLGMDWHVPNLGSYVNNQFQYTAHLTVGLNINDLVLITPEDFRRHRCTINSTLHTKNRFEYTCVVPQYELTLTVRYFLVEEDALGCILTLSTTFPAPIAITSTSTTRTPAVYGSMASTPCKTGSRAAACWGLPAKVMPYRKFNAI